VFKQETTRIDPPLQEKFECDPNYNEEKSQHNSAFECSWAKIAGQQLATKTIDCGPTGHLYVKDYDNAKYFWFARRTYRSLDDFAAALRSAATAKQVFLVRGQLRPGLNPADPHRRVYKIGDPELTLVGPDRSWGVFDIDGASIDGLSFRDSCLIIRDHLLPAEFRRRRMVATVTSGTTLKPGLRARLYFLIDRPIPNRTLELYATALNANVPDLNLDGGVFQTGKAIYTARPIFKGLSDPVPAQEWVVILDGDSDIVELDIGRFRLPKQNGSRYTAEPDWASGISVDWWGDRPPLTFICSDPFIADLIANAGFGICPDSYSEFGKRCLQDAFFRIIEATPGVRYPILNRESFCVGQRVSEGHIPEKYAGPTLIEAARRMRFNDKYDEARLRQIIEVGLSDGARHPRSYSGED
jgi:hypothetical protein